jgi:CubicO group peptidase (beta-lactamase class C family)
LILILSISLSATILVSLNNRDDSVSKLDRLIPQLMEKYGVPGTAVSLVRDGEVVWLEGYGLADRDRGVPVTADTVFQVASISKAVTSWGVMRLVESGQLELDAPVEQYLTRWHLPTSNYDASGVTIRRLLSHSAGLSVGGYPGLRPDTQLPSLEESLSGDNGGSGEVCIIMEPGAQFSYSGGGFTLLQLIIEEVTGETFSAYMQREVLDPLGMVHSSFEWRADLRPATAAAYSGNGTQLPNYLFTEQAAAGLYTTASDLARFVAAEMSGHDGELAGRGVISQDTLALMFTPAILQQANILFKIERGLGQEIQTLPDGTRLIQHPGGNRGWSAFIMANPGEAMGVVILTNSDNGRSLCLDAMTELVIPIYIGMITRILILILTLGIAICAIFLFKGLNSSRKLSQGS